ncbi:hypothetical protein [Cognatishimia maritima]|nr:hypothetical protein [Cognatishimia maritima]
MPRTALDQRRRLYERQGYIGTFYIQKAQHSPDRAPESIVPLKDVRNRI